MSNNAKEKSMLHFIITIVALGLFAILLMKGSILFKILYGSDLSITFWIIFIGSPVLIGLVIFKKVVLKILFGNYEELRCDIVKSYYLEFFAVYKTLATILVLGMTLLWALGRESISFEEFQSQSILIIGFFIYIFLCLLVISSELKNTIVNKDKDENKNNST